MANYVAALDSGKGLSKLIISEYNKESKTFKEADKFEVTTKYTVLKSDQNEDTTKNSHFVEFEDGRYITGDQGITPSFTTSKTQMVHKMCSYTAICNAIEKDVENHITMVLACPVLSLMSIDTKEEYVKFMSNDGNVVNIKVDGNTYRFYIDVVIVKSEASGLTYLDLDIFNNKRVGIIDIGGLNMTFMEYYDSVINASSRDSKDLGSNELVNRLMTDISVYKKQNISRETAVFALENGYITNASGTDEESRKVITDTRLRFVDSILESLGSRGVFIDDFNAIIVIGGTSLYLAEELKSKIPNSFTVDDPQWASVNGLFELIKAYVISLCK